MNGIEIFVIIVTYNPNLINLSKLINNVFSTKTSIIVVDNGSNKDFFFENIELIKLNKNYGIAYAQNVGIIRAIDLKAEYIFFFDQDSFVDNNFIGDLYEEFIKIRNLNFNIAAIGPRFFDEKYSFWSPALVLNKYGFIDKIDISNINSLIEVSVIISSGSMVSVSALKNIGYMNEKFFIDYVDTEWCLRAINNGYKIFLSENVKMSHSVGEATIRFLGYTCPVHSGFRRYYRVRNLFLMWKMSYIPKILILKLMVTNFFIQILLILLKDKKRDYIKFYLKAIKDGFKEARHFKP
ncbi:glycosyltransferase family 2 protein [Acinetobacter soli]|uniref:glycosyltransferase family 2 protein n=1 Tax=Acinetobacter soli TaxID=487316 RepID=UPI0026DF0B4C|nr:glycosyltransferase family 2 protein [Acinetobacter soli]